jgi:hypothetical protein
MADSCTKDKRDLFKESIGRTLDRLPPEVEKWYSSKKIRFVFPCDKKLGCTLNKKEIKAFDAIIILYDEFLTIDEDYQELCILHELAHVKLKHTHQKKHDKEQKVEDEADSLAWYWYTTIQRTETMKLIEENARKMMRLFDGDFEDV